MYIFYNYLCANNFKKYVNHFCLFKLSDLMCFLGFLFYYLFLVFSISNLLLYNFAVYILLKVL